MGSLFPTPTSTSNIEMLLMERKPLLKKLLDKSTMNSDLLISRNLNIDLKFSSKLLDKLANTMQATTLGDKESMTSQI